jgi:hypothetical protein
MKLKITSILLLIFLFAPALIMYFGLQYQKSQVRHEIKWRMIKGIDKDELVLLKFTEEDSQKKLLWKHSKEFEYKGQMYDIIETKIIGDTIYYWCWWDHEETNLNKQLTELVANSLGKDPLNKEKQKQLDNFYKTLYHSKFVPLKFLTAESGQEIFYIVKNYLSVSHKPHVPPPETC